MRFDLPKSGDLQPNRSRKETLLQIYCWILVAVFVFVGYALSIGPMYWYWYDSEMEMASPFVAIFYRPLIYSCEFKPFGNFMNWYVSFWI